MSNYPNGRREIAEQFKAAQQAATPDWEYWDNRGKDICEYGIPTGRKLEGECHQGVRVGGLSCLMKENDFRFAALARNSPIGSALLEAEVEIERLTLENARLKAATGHLQQELHMRPER